MKLGFKKITAAIVAAAAAVSMSGCMDNGKIMTVDGMEINNGIYLYYQQTAYSTAQTKISEAQQEKLDKLADEIVNQTSSDSSSDTSSSSSEIKYFEQTIDGKSTSQWVKDETLRLVKQYVGVLRLCEQKGISLEQSEIDEIAEQVKGVWENSDYYMQYFFGCDTAGQYYESNGVGRESYTLISNEKALKDKLFVKLYDKDGENPTPDEEVAAYAKENYACGVVLGFPYKDYKGNTLTSDSDKKAVDDLAEEYANRISNGESLIDIKYDYDLKEERDEAREQIEDYYDKNPVEGKTKEEYLAEELEKLTVDREESEDDIIEFFKKDNNTLVAEVSEFMFNAKDDGKATLLKTEGSVFVIVRYDVTGKTEWIEDNRTTILMELKNDDFNKYLDDFSANLSVNANSYLVDTKYKPERLESTSAAN